MNSAYLAEAFTELSLLNEETYNLTDDGIEKLTDDIEDISIDDTIDIIDTEAETEEDIKDSYLGKVVLDCCVCHSKLYKDKADIVLDEESGIANAEDECPYCFTTEGFKVIGEIGKFKPTTDVETDETDVDVDTGTNTEDDDLDEALNEKIYHKGLRDATVRDAKQRSTKEQNWNNENKGKKSKERLDKPGLIDRTFNTKYNKQYNDIKKAQRVNDRADRQYALDHEDDYERDSQQELKNARSLANDTLYGYGSLDHSYSDKQDKMNNRKEFRKKAGIKESATLSEAPIYGLEPQYDSRKSFYNKAQVDVNDENGVKTLMSYNTPVCRIANGKVELLPAWDYSATTLRHVKEFLQQNGFDVYSKSQMPRHYEVVNESVGHNKFKLNASQLKEEIKNAVDYYKNDELGCTTIKMTDNLAVCVGWSDGFDENDSDIIHSKEQPTYALCAGIKVWTSDSTRTDFDWINSPYDDEEVWNTDTAISTNENYDSLASYFMKELETLSNYDISDDGKILDKKNAVNESLENVSIETDTDVINVTSQPKEEIAEVAESTDETIMPVSDETVNDIEEENDEEEVAMDEFDEDNFDDLGEQYLKKNYSNVESYKTNSVKASNGKLVVEGVIKFNSGKSKNTQFIFEAKDKLRNGKYRLIGENKQISRGKKSFTITGNINESKFIAESMTYNYRAKDPETNASKRLYGTVRKSL